MLAVSRRRLFGNDAQYPSVLYDRGGVVQNVSHAHGQARHRNHVAARARIAYAQQFVHGRRNQRLLKKEVAAGMRRNAELGCDKQSHLFARHPLHRLDNPVRIVAAVRDFYVGRDARDLDKTILHAKQSLSAPR